MSKKTAGRPDDQAHLSMIQQYLQGYGEIEPSHEFPDIVHVFGSWDASAHKKLEQCHKLLIPTVFSSLGQLAPWHFPKCPSPTQVLQTSAQKRATQQASALIVWGELEKQEMEKRKWNEQIHVIPNAVTTSLISPEEMAHETIKLYQEVLATHDQLTHQRIQEKLNTFPNDKSPEKEVCHSLLYLRYQYHRRNVKKQTLKELNDTLNNLEYDEDALNDMLEQLNEEQFAARIMQVLSEDYQLTEGFMPLDPLNDKQTQRIKEAINPTSNYNERKIKTDDEYET
jgi:hypothetical protein